MKEYVITIQDKPYHVVIKKLGTETAIVEVDGREFEVGIERKIKRHLEPLEVKPVVKTVSETAAEPAAEPAVPMPRGNEVASPLPGLILQVLVKEGERVESGQTVVKMEAMKMENEIKAPKSGRVKKVFVKEGDSVLENVPLVEIGD